MSNNKLNVAKTNKRKNEELQNNDSNKKIKGNTKYKIMQEYSNVHGGEYKSYNNIGTFDTLEECQKFIFEYNKTFFDNIKLKSDKIGCLLRNKWSSKYHIWRENGKNSDNVEQITIENHNRI